MNKQLKKLSQIFFIALAATAVSCSNDDDNASEYAEGEQHVVLQGEDNMRDMGGYTGHNGKRVLYNKLYRSGELSGLTVADLEVVNGLDIKQVVDLRTSAEREEHPDATIDGVVRYELSLLGESTTSGAATSMEAVMGLILSGQMTAEEMMIPAYTVLDDAKINSWTTIFDLLETGKTTLWHCTAGKDRAGMTAALVLSSLGVDRDTIIADFMLSNNYLAAYNQQTIDYINSQYGAGMGEQLQPLLGVEESYILAFFDAVDAQYGSMDNFLDALGVDKNKMRSHYLER